MKWGHESKQILLNEKKRKYNIRLTSVFKSLFQLRHD